MDIRDLIDEASVYYLASPYSHPSAYVREQRYLDIVKIAVDLIKLGFTLIEPIAMSHHHATKFGLNGGYEFWKDRDRKFIERCDGVIVATLPGWSESIGVTDEIAYAKSLDMPVYYLDPVDYSVCQGTAEKTEAF